MTYDALERMVEQDKSGSYSQIVYDPSGDKLGLMSNTSTITRAFAPLPGGAKAEYNASGLFVYAHADWLGSWRLFSTPTRSLYTEQYYAPFGEQYPSTSSVPWASLAGMNAETDAYVYDASFREYAIQGRWPSPDPAGISAADPTNPQSWNRYAYVMNNPLAIADLLGLNAASVQLPVGCPTVEAVPQSTSQQVAGGGGPFDPGYEAPPPQASSCGLRSNPFNAPSTTWSDGADVTGIFANNPGLFGLGASIDPTQSFISGNFPSTPFLGLVDQQTCGPDTHSAGNEVMAHCTDTVTQLFNPASLAPNTWQQSTGTNGLTMGFSGSFIQPLYYGIGPAVTGSYVPSLGLSCLGGGVGVAGGRNVSGGPIMVSSASAKSILSGPSLSGGYNVTPGRGVQGSINFSGSSGGWSVGVPGASFAVTISACWGGN